jgi:hypothetical protein
MRLKVLWSKGVVINDCVKLVVAPDRGKGVAKADATVMVEAIIGIGTCPLLPQPAPHLPKQSPLAHSISA